MSVEQNKVLFRRFLEEVANQGKLEVIDEILAPDVIEHEVFPGIPATREGVKQALAMFRSAFPDLKVTLEDIIGEGDKVVARSTWRGTHKGEFLGIAPSGKKVEFVATDTVRFANGKLAEHWGATDNLTLMQQLGAIPTPDAAGL